MKKATTIFILFIILIITGCATPTKTSTTIPGNLVSIIDNPDPDYAYFVITTQGDFRRSSNVLILRGPEKEDNVTIEFNNDRPYQVLKVKPTSYRNDFGVYLWDVFKWSLIARYEVGKEYYQHRFIAEKNKVYYLGHFDEFKFVMISNFEEPFRSKYPNFKDLEIINPYQQ